MNDTHLQLSIDDMMHIANLLRDDLLISKAAKEEYPLDDEVEHSMLRSKRVLLKITSYALLQAYEPDNDTSGLEERNRLN
jgi:hypothetical protein